MFQHNVMRSLKTMLMGIVAGGVFISFCSAQSSVPEQKPSVNAHHYRSSQFPKRAEMYYGGVWGVDSLIVRYAEAGELIRFSYRVLDPNKAALMNDKKNQPLLIDPRAGVQLVIPTMDKIGQLRQTNQPEAGKSYWMAFSNKGRLVKRGDRVSVTIGPFRAEGLEVQ